MKKFLALALSAMMILSVVPALCSDEPSDWAKAEIDEAMVQLLVDTGSQMDYQRPITRKEFAILALDAYSSFAGIPETDGGITNPFTDMDEPMVLLAYHAGIIKGRSETEFDPDASISRQEICVMLSRVVSGTQEGYTEEIIASFAPDVAKFSDGASVADWAAGAVSFCADFGIVKGVSDTEIGPLADCTMEQALILVKRLKDTTF